MTHDFHSAYNLIIGLKVGDRVRVTREGRTDDLFVSYGPTRADGQFGSPESLHVIVTYGPGRYAFNVGVDQLWRRRMGHGWIGGGTEIELIGCGHDGCEDLNHVPSCPRYEIPGNTPEALEELDMIFSHLADDHGETEE